MKNLRDHPEQFGADAEDLLLAARAYGAPMMYGVLIKIDPQVEDPHLTWTLTSHGPSDPQTVQDYKEKDP